MSIFKKIMDWFRFKPTNKVNTDQPVTATNLQAAPADPIQPKEKRKRRPRTESALQQKEKKVRKPRKTAASTESSTSAAG